MTTQQHTSTSTAERIRLAVDAVAKRIRIQDFDIVGIQGTAYASANLVTVSVQVDNRRDLNKAASYFQLSEVRDLAGDTTIIGPSKVVGLHGAQVEVFGPTSDETAVAR